VGGGKSLLGLEEVPERVPRRETCLAAGGLGDLRARSRVPLRARPDPGSGGAGT